MSSHFNAAVTPKNPPTWCHPGPIPPIPDEVDGVPATLVGFAYWLDLNAAPPIDVHVSLTLTYDPGIPGWSGSGSSPPYSIDVTMIRLEEPDHYDVEITINRAGEYVDDDSWHNIEVPPVKPFDSTELTHIHDEGVDENGFHAIG